MDGEEEEKEREISKKMLRVVVGLTLGMIPHDEALDIWTDCIKEIAT